MGLVAWWLCNPEHTWWNPHETYDVYAYAKQCGVNFVRLALNGWLWNTNYYDSVTDEYYRDAVDKVIQFCKQLGIRVMFEFHAYSAPFPADPWGGNWDYQWSFIHGENKLEWFKFFETASQIYGDEPTVAAYGLLNEPVSYYNIGMYAGEQIPIWHDACEELIAIIRSHAPKAMIFVDIPGFQLANWFVGGGNYLLSDSNVVYTWHYSYHADLGSLVGYPWEPAPYAKAYYEGRFAEARQLFLNNLMNESPYWKLLNYNGGYPIVCAEFGVTIPTDVNWETQMMDFYNLTEQYHVGIVQLSWEGEVKPYPEVYNTIYNCMLTWEGWWGDEPLSVNEIGSVFRDYAITLGAYGYTST